MIYVTLYPNLYTSIICIILIAQLWVGVEQGLPTPYPWLSRGLVQPHHVSRPAD